MTPNKEDYFKNVFMRLAWNFLRLLFNKEIAARM